MVVRGHAVLSAEKLVGAAVVAYVYNKKQVVAPHGALDEPLAVARGEPGAAAADAEAFRLAAGLLGPPQQVGLNLVWEDVGALKGDDTQGGQGVVRAEKKLCGLFLHVLAIPFLNTGMIL